MLKNKKQLLIGIILFSLSIILITIISLKISSKGKQVILDCENKTKDEIECKLKGRGNKYDVSNVSMRIEVSKNAELKEVKIDSIWQGSGNDGIVELYTDVDKKGTFNIGTFKIKKKDNKKVKISLNRIIYFDENFEKHPVKDLIKEM